jgi:hypothetical protein
MLYSVSEGVSGAFVAVFTHPARAEVRAMRGHAAVWVDKAGRVLGRTPFLPDEHGDTRTSSVRTTRRDGQRANVTLNAVVAPPTRQRRVAVSQQSAFHLEPGDSTLASYLADGRLFRRFRLPREVWAGHPEHGTAVRPALHADRAGNAWIEVPSSAREQGTRWLLFSRDGTRVGVAVTPSGEEILEIGKDYVLLLRRMPSGDAVSRCSLGPRRPDR